MDRRRGVRSPCARTGKRRYASWWEARDAVKTIERDTGEDHGRPYRCEHCGGWHLGRTS